MKMKSAGLALVVLSGCLSHALPSDVRIEATFPPNAPSALLPKTIKVVTFNVHGQTGEVIAHALRTDRALQTADLIVLEEVHGHADCSAACVVARELGFHSVYAPEFVDRDGTDGIAILSRGPIDSAQIIDLPDYDVVINSERTSALAATLRIDDRPVTVYAVHLTNRLTVSQRRRQMMPVLAHAQRQQTPIIIAGDFNTSPFTWLFHVIPILTGTQDDRFEELLRAHGFATPVAESGATSRYLAMKLDGIYTRGFETGRFATADALGISDHLALWAQMTETSRHLSH
jgi:endonuclease/exonuclease/phosphatase family metal-dependent hydrolase